MALVQMAAVVAAAQEGGYTVTPRKGYTTISGNGGVVVALGGNADGPVLRVDTLGQPTDAHVALAAKAGGRQAKPGTVATSGVAAQTVAKALLPRLQAGKVARTSAAQAKAAAAAAAAKAAKAKAKPAKAAAPAAAPAA